MGKINYGRVILGGIVSGIIATILDGFSNVVLLGQLMTDAMKSLNRPSSLPGPAVFGLILLEFVGGILAVWTYAAIRPRFGAGARTAVYAGLISWAFVCLPNAANALTGLFGPSLSLYLNLLSLASSIIATIGGAALYKEAESTAAYQAVAEARQTVR